MAVIAEVALRGGQEWRFEDLYDSYQPRVYRTCLAILRNADDAAEATQEVFSRVLPLLTTLREPHLWLQTVARNYCLDQLRRQKVRGTGPSLDEETAGSRRHDPERETMLRDALRQAFEALTPRERRALARVLLMDDSLADIAGMLGISYGAAAQVVSRARRRAALAARAVIGASLAGLARLTLPRERGRATRLAMQALESGQNVVLAAAVVFTAGSMTQVVAAGAPGSTPTAVSAATAAPRSDVSAADTAPAAVAPAVAPTVALRVVPTLPPGYTTGPVGVSIQSTGDGTPGGPAGPGPGDQGVGLQVTPIYGGDCTGAIVGAGAPGASLAPHTVQVCP